MLREAVRRVRARADFGACNFLLSDSTATYAHRFGRTLFLLERHGPGDAVRVNRESREGVIVQTPWSQQRYAVLVASERLTDEPWEELAEGMLLRIDRRPLPRWRLVDASRRSQTWRTRDRTCSRAICTGASRQELDLKQRHAHHLRRLVRALVRRCQVGRRSQASFRGRGASCAWSTLLLHVPREKDHPDNDGRRAGQASICPADGVRGPIAAGRGDPLGLVGPVERRPRRRGPRAPMRIAAPPTEVRTIPR